LEPPRGAHHSLDGGMVLVPRASAAWQHAFNSVTPEATMAFQSTGVSFIVAGVPIARDSLLAEAGLDLAINRSVTLGVSYVGQVASNVTDHAGQGEVQLEVLITRFAHS
jgi:outer membrane autotransporter protein